jgi:hypothetical protein
MRGRFSAAGDVRGVQVGGANPRRFTVRNAAIRNSSHGLVRSEETDGVKMHQDAPGRFVRRDGPDLPADRLLRAIVAHRMEKQIVF